MPPCPNSIIDIGPNLVMLGLQALILAGAIVAMYRSHTSLTNAVQSLSAAVAGPVAAAVQGHGETPPNNGGKV
jgi:hypothetical protein